MSAVAARVTRPDDVPTELEPAWRLLEEGGLGAVVVDVDGGGGALWSALTAHERHVELGRRLVAGGNLHASLDEGSFAVLRVRAEEHAAPGAPLAALWLTVPEWVHPGLTRADVVAAELQVLADATVPDPDVALLLAAAASLRLPVSAVSHGRLTGDQVRRRLEHGALDAVTWRAVLTPADHDEADLVALAPREGDGDALVLSAGPVTAAAGPGSRVVRLGAAGSASEGAADLAVSRVARRLVASAEAHAVPAALRDAWFEGASVLGPVLAGFAEWSVRHAAGHPGGRLLALAEPGALLPELLAEVAVALDLPVRVDVLPVTPDLLAVADQGDALLGTALALALGGVDRGAAEVAALLGVGVTSDDGATRGAAGGPGDLVGLLTTLRDDPAAAARATEQAAGLRDELVAAAGDATTGPLPVCQVGGAGRTQTRLAEVLRHAGVPRHVVGLHLASDPSAADAALGEAGGEVHGYLANLGRPAGAHAAAVAWRARLEQVAGAPDRSRTSLANTGDDAETLEDLRTEAARRGVHAFLRQHLRLLTIAGYPARLHDAGPRLAERLPPRTPVAVAPPADGLVPPPWVDAVVVPLEGRVAAARAEVARRDAVVASRPYRAVALLLRIVRRLRAG
ncbi:hypothetical protein [Patulibacter minatonensis]|uniref:hypothetical protein n=1 Tax=Patulibacter minatonensis TaxID=298163 RepID=UPI00047977E2|nr:hypothetical protein [Patulibacter minatonensis]